MRLDASHGTWNHFYQDLLYNHEELKQIMMESTKDISIVTQEMEIYLNFLLFALALIDTLEENKKWNFP